MLSRMQFFFWCFLLCGLTVSRLLAVVVSDPPAATATENSAIIRWGTDVECGTTLKLGVNPAELKQRIEGTVGTKHEVSVNGLLPGTQYYFSIGTAKKALGKGVFTTKGKSAAGVFSAKPAPAPLAKPPTPVYTPPPTAKTWGDRTSLQDHFNRHGADFHAMNPDDYASKAWLFLQRAMDEELPAKLDEDGTLRIWDPRNRSFAAYNRNFTTKTYFRPNSSDYFQRQPGKPVKVRHAPPKS